MNTKEQAIDLVKAVCDHYRITLEQLQEVKRINHWKVTYNDYGELVRLSEIRMALSYFIYRHCPLKLVEIAPMVGYKDHSTMSIYRKRIEFYIQTEDPKFFPYYLKVIDIASDLGISMRLTRVRSYSDILFMDHHGKINLVD
jgi:chromosomal replication initiation ATPase DnaA